MFILICIVITQINYVIYYSGIPVVCDVGANVGEFHPLALYKVAAIHLRSLVPLLSRLREYYTSISRLVATHIKMYIS